MNILYIGSSGALSLVPFKKLLSTDHTITAVGIYKPVAFNGKVIAVENESLALAANQRNLPLLDLSQPIDFLLEQCQKLSIDIILMSCYGKRLPEAIINLAGKVL
jgi:methionyl-tRNA formyltransferase